MKPEANKNILLVSYHAFREDPFRPSALHRFFKEQISQDNALAYSLVCSDWDHLTKTRHDFSGDPAIKTIRVPGYFKNLSVNRVISHMVFSLKLLFSTALWRGDVFFVCVPPSLPALVVALVATLKRKPFVFDVVDLWPEALPAGDAQKKLFMTIIGGPWVFLRNCLYGRASMLLTHCKYFIEKIGAQNSLRLSYVPLSQGNLQMFLLESNRPKLASEIRILVLGSINNVIDIESLVSLLASLRSNDKTSSCRKVILEIIGDGESKTALLQQVLREADFVQVLDHGKVFDSKIKGEVLSRCHFGYNGYRNTTAIGVTYKAVDFATAGVVFLNCVQGDLTDLITEYGAGFNFTKGLESELAERVLSLSDEAFLGMSRGSRKMALNLFHPERFEKSLTAILEKV